MKSKIGDPNLATAEPRRPKPRPLLSWLSFGAVVSLVGIIGFKFPETALAGVAAPFLTVTVQVDNYSQASPAVLAAAEQEAGRILGEAGLRAVWLECPMVPSTAEPQGPCKKAPEATEIRLRMVPDEKSVRPLWLSLPNRNREAQSVRETGLSQVSAISRCASACKRSSSVTDVEGPSRGSASHGRFGLFQAARRS